MRLIEAMAAVPMRPGDMLVLLVDMVIPQRRDAIRLRDVRRSGQAKNFFNTLVNVAKVNRGVVIAASPLVRTSQIHS